MPRWAMAVLHLRVEMFKFLSEARVSLQTKAQHLWKKEDSCRITPVLEQRGFPHFPPSRSLRGGADEQAMVKVRELFWTSLNEK